MTIIHATCPGCGTVSLTPGEITLNVYLCGDRQTGEYSFSCPMCEAVAVKPADDEIVEMLTSVVKANYEHLPAELLEHPGPEVPSICIDDVLDLMLALR